MRINHDLMREILRLIADNDGPNDISTSTFYKLHNSERLVGYHVQLLIEAGFIKGYDARCIGYQYDYDCIELTYQGQLYFEYIENDTVWNKLKNFIKEKSLPFSIAVIEAYVKQSL